MKRLRSDQRVVIVHDDDPDGICSAVLMSKDCLKQTMMEPGVFSTEFGRSLTPRLLSELRRGRPDAVIFTDVPAIPKNLLTQLSKTSEVLVLDHHYPETYEGVTYSNPRLIEGSAYLPTSYLAYQVSMEAGLPDALCWIAGIGVLADHGVKQCGPLMNRIRVRYPSLVNGFDLVDEQLMDKSKLGALTKIIASATIASPRSGAPVAFKALNESKTPWDILDAQVQEAEMLIKWYQDVEDEFRRITDNIKKNVESLGSKVILFRFHSSLRIKSLIANHLPRIYPQKIILVFQEDGDYTHVSLRRGDKNDTDLRELVQAAIEEIPEANGGGHPEASAARIPSHQLRLFLQRVEKLAAQEN